MRLLRALLAASGVCAMAIILSFLAVWFIDWASIALGGAAPLLILLPFFAAMVADFYSDDADA